MKRTLLFYLLALSNLSVIAQGNAMLTKQETINYINNLLKKTIGLEYNDASVVENISLVSTSSGLCFSYTASGESAFAYNAYEKPSWGAYPKCSKRSYEFDPNHVKDVTLKSYGHGSIHYCVISFIKKELVKEKIEGCPEEYYGRKQMVNEVLLFFIMVEQKDYDKLKKALQHLVSLYKAEDDPFGE